MNKLSIYDDVSVILTARGADCVNTYYHQQPAVTPEEKRHNMNVNYREGDIFTDCLFVMMNVFGKWLYDGCMPLFEDDVIQYKKEDF